MLFTPGYINCLMACDQVEASGVEWLKMTSSIFLQRHNRVLGEYLSQQLVHGGCLRPQGSGAHSTKRLVLVKTTQRVDFPTSRRPQGNPGKPRQLSCRLHQRVSQLSNGTRAFWDALRCIALSLLVGNRRQDLCCDHKAREKLKVSCPFCQPPLRRRGLPVQRPAPAPNSRRKPGRQGANQYPIQIPWRDVGLGSAACNCLPGIELVFKTGVLNVSRFISGQSVSQCRLQTGLLVKDLDQVLAPKEMDILLKTPLIR